MSFVEQCCKRGVKIGENVDLVNAEIDYCFGHLITIGDNVFVGYGCIILPNVTIGNKVICTYDEYMRKN